MLSKEKEEASFKNHKKTIAPMGVVSLVRIELHEWWEGMLGQMQREPLAMSTLHLNNWSISFEGGSFQIS